MRSATVRRLLERASALLKMILDDDLRPDDVSLDDARAELAQTIAELRTHGTVRFAVTI